MWNPSFFSSYPLDIIGILIKMGITNFLGELHGSFLILIITRILFCCTFWRMFINICSMFWKHLGDNFLKHNGRLDFTSCWHFWIKLSGKGPAWISPTRHRVWTQNGFFRAQGPRLGNTSLSSPLTNEHFFKI